MVLKTTLLFLLLLHSLHANALQKGEKIFSIMCDKEKVHSLLPTDNLSLKKKIATKHLCGNISTKNLDALVLFLNHNTNNTAKQILTVPKDARCPVCGMFTAKFPKWVAIMIDKKGKTYYFDGVKDMMKFYFDPKRYHHDKLHIQKIYVTDYYTLEPIDAKEAYYVIGSNIYGPMGEELIPFKTKEDAKIFLDEHHGKKSLTFDTIKEKFLY